LQTLNEHRAGGLKYLCHGSVPYSLIFIQTSVTLKAAKLHNQAAWITVKFHLWHSVSSIVFTEMMAHLNVS